MPHMGESAQLPRHDSQPLQTHRLTLRRLRMILAVPLASAAHDADNPMGRRRQVLLKYAHLM